MTPTLKPRRAAPFAALSLAAAVALGALGAATPALALDDGQEGLLTTLLSVTGLGGKKTEDAIE